MLLGIFCRSHASEGLLSLALVRFVKVVYTSENE